MKLAREEGELVGEQFLHWFLQEQREEVASMTELLAIVERNHAVAWPGQPNCPTRRVGRRCSEWTDRVDA